MVVLTHLNELSTHQILAKTIFRENGEILLSAGYQFTSSVLKKLPDTGQEYFWIFEEGIDEIHLQENLSEQVDTQTKSILYESAEAVRRELGSNNRTISEIKSMMLEESGKFHGVISADYIAASAVSMVGDMMARTATLISLSGIRNANSWLYQHAVDTAVVATMLGKRFGFNRFELEEIVMGCLVMDTGYLVMPEDLVNRTGRLNYEEFTLLKEHPNYGFTILKANPKLPLISAHIAYQHHERQDGSGYPRMLHGFNELPIKRGLGRPKEIHRYAEIVSVAETYVRLSHPRIGAPKMTPQEVIEVLIRSAGTQLNRPTVDALVTMIPIFPVGSRVVIIKDDKKADWLGCSGVVVKANEDFLDKPTIVLLKDRYKSKMKPVKLDLTRHLLIELQFQQLMGS
jgi:HD-GYP domain-containing protein (c-di-GMP phosphodiesterase class II)